MAESEVPLSKPLGETVLPPPPEAAARALEEARKAPPQQRKRAVAAVAGANPAFLDAWAELAGLAEDPVESYAYARVGYHRGLDALRAAGWRGSGYVRWEHPSNRGFLRSLEALRRAAASLGEDAEAQRCATFLLQLDPSWGKRGGPR